MTIALVVTMDAHHGDNDGYSSDEDYEVEEGRLQWQRRTPSAQPVYGDTETNGERENELRGQRWSH